MKNKRIIYIAIMLLAISTIAIKWNYHRTKIYHTPIQIKLSRASIPLIEVDIQNKKHLLEMDLGSKSQLTLNKKIISNLIKKDSGTLISRDMLGNKYETPAYLIPLVKVGDFSFGDVIVNEESEDFVLNT